MLKGASHTEIESLLDTKRTKQLMALALFDDEARAGEVMGKLNGWDRRLADAYREINEGAHGAAIGGFGPLDRFDPSSGQAGAGADVSVVLLRWANELTRTPLDATKGGGPGWPPCSGARPSKMRWYDSGGDRAGGGEQLDAGPASLPRELHRRRARRPDLVCVRRTHPGLPPPLLRTFPYGRRDHRLARRCGRADRRCSTPPASHVTHWRPGRGRTADPDRPTRLGEGPEAEL